MNRQLTVPSTVTFTHTCRSRPSNMMRKWTMASR